uniref:C2H2-type domain-containing protein n=2 Tax=Bursaphelenchus xylophilus TaxID=6326 RepID=A0A1I7S756_BURXY
MSESPHDTLTALRRSKRNKFHLDVAAVFSGSSNPDRRRTTLDAKYVSKEANHAVSSTRNLMKSSSVEPSPSDVSFVDTEQNEENIEKELLEPSEKIPIPQKSKVAMHPVTTEPPEITADERAVKGGLSVDGLQDINSLDGIKVENIPLKHGVHLTFACSKCGVTLKSKSGLISHSKYCDTGLSSKRKKRKKIGSERHTSDNSLIKFNQTREFKINAGKEDNETMPLLKPEGDPFDPSPSKKSKNNNWRPFSELPESVQSIDILALKKFNLPALPPPLLKPLPGAKSKEFYCCECPYKSADDTLFRIHRAMHTGERPNKCSACSFSCFSPESLYSHLDLHLPNDESSGEKRRVIKKKEIEYIACNTPNVIRCSQCTFRTVHLERFRQHRLDHVQSQRQRLVSIIKRSNNNSNQPEEPVSTLAGPNPKIQFCNVCEFRTEGNEPLEHHAEYHGSGQLYRCDICDYASDEKVVRDFHEKHHHTMGSLSNHLRSLAAAILDTKVSGTPLKCQRQLYSGLKDIKYPCPSLAVQSLIKALE